MERRAYGTGSLKELDGEHGRWLLRISLGKHPETGRYEQRSWRFFAPSREAAERHTAELMASTRTHRHRNASATVATLLDEYWEFSRLRGLAPATLRTNRRIIDQVFVPDIGTTKIGALTTFQIDHVYMRLMTKTRPPQPSSVKRYHSVLAAALNQAVRWGWIGVNPAALATLPAIPRLRAVVPTPQDVRDLIRVCHESDPQLGMFVLMAATTGCRRGELVALRWSHIRGDVLSVRSAVHEVDGEWRVKTTKTGQMRLLVLGPQLMSALRDWKKSCQRDARASGTSLSADVFIFPGSSSGTTILNPNKMTVGFAKVADSMDPPRLEMHLHSLRHFAATELVAAGISIPDVAERLGHADPTWTLIVYSHSRADRQRDAALIAEAALGTGVDSVL